MEDEQKKVKGFLSTKSVSSEESNRFKVGAVYHQKYMSAVPYVSIGSGVFCGSSAVARVPWSIIKENCQNGIEKAKKSLEKSISLERFGVSASSHQKEDGIHLNEAKRQTAKTNQVESTQAAAHNGKHSTGAIEKKEKEFFGFGVKTELSLGTLIRKPLRKFRAVLWVENDLHGISFD